jgi:hypothetical protein
MHGEALSFGVLQFSILQLLNAVFWILNSALL